MSFLNNIFFEAFVFIVFSFFSGSVPYGLLYGLIRGVDIRTIGSGNIGATNVTRQFGFWQGFIPIAILDMSKGILPVVLFKLFFPRSGDPLLFDTLEIVVGLVAVLGHVFSPFLKFKGGKGAATTGGVLFAWNYIVGLISLGIFGLVYFTFGKKIVGRASIVAATALPIVVFFTPQATLPFEIVSLLLAILLLLSHKKNIKEWISGEDLEKKLQAKKSKQKAKS